VRFGGTYDQRWLDEEFPLLPADFDPRFYNAAPEDQQLAAYRPGETVRLRGLTAEGDTRFQLPPFAVPVTVFERGELVTEYVVQADTIVIEPGARRFSVLGRQTHVPHRNVLSIRDVLVGAPTAGWLRARATRKGYVGRLPVKP
jgi:hypothetical protein